MPDISVCNTNLQWGLQKKNEYSSSHHISAHHRRLLTIYNSVLLTVEVANIKPGAQATIVVDEHLAYCTLWQGGGSGDRSGLPMMANTRGRLRLKEVLSSGFTFIKGVDRPSYLF